jgi:glutamyl-tRNA synthetase
MGNIRTAVFNWMFAKKHGGAFILRIEDTDRERSKKEYERGIYEDLEWIGITPDESPVHGGDFGPYRQTERFEIYREQAEILRNMRNAYPCFCAPEDLEARRKHAMEKGLSPGYDNRCRGLSVEIVEQYIKEGKPYSLRFRVTGGRKVRVNDTVRGTVAWDTSEIPDFVIMKSDATPTYHFGVVVDDHLMGITHVIRGRGHLDNTALHIMLYDALGYPAPEYAHISHTRGLSKRKGSENIRGYREAGYLGAAVLNYACLLGWYPRDEKEKFNPAERAAEFELSDLQKADSTFDHQKFNWLAGQYIRDLDADELARLAKPFFEKAGISDNNPEHYKKVIRVVQPRAKTLAELPAEAAAFYGIIEPGDEEKEILATEKAKSVLAALREKLASLDVLSPESFNSAIAEAGKEAGVKGKDLYFPIRAALIGRAKGLELKLVGPLLGKDECIRRLKVES